MSDKMLCWRVTRPVCTAVLAGFFLSCTSAADDRGHERSGRIAPPSTLTCARDDLTSWTGEVTGYRRDENVTWLEISTDEETVEQTTIGHQDLADAQARYLLWGEPFTSLDWGRIEESPGQLFHGTRATAWICQDGNIPPVIDWRPGEER